MKLQINLIAEHERRSAAPVSVRSLLCALGLLVIGVILVTVGIKMFRVMELERQHEQMLRVASDLERRKADEQARDALLLQAQAHAQEFAFWLDARHRWSHPLHAIARSTPGQVQIERLRLQESTLERDRTLRRFPQMTLHCRVEADSPEPVIRSFQAFLADKSGDPTSIPEDFRPLSGPPHQTPAHAFRITLRFPSPEALP